MGNLQSVLGDCQLGNVPAYLQQFVGKGQDGDEAYMVYNDRGQFRSTAEEQSGLYYTGPNQQHVHSNLLRKDHKSNAPTISEGGRQALSELVDSCVDGIDSWKVRASIPIGTSAPGGQTFKLPQGQDKYLHSQAWDHAHLANNVAVRVDPLKNASVEEVQATRKKPSKKKAKETNKKEKQLVVETKSKDSTVVLETTLEGGPHQEEMFDSDEEESGSLPIVTNGPSTPKNQTRSGRVSSNSPARSETPSLDVCREEEEQLLRRLNVVVHPSEVPEQPFSEWYLVDAEWFREWSAFLKGASRPGRIDNRKLVDITANNTPWPNQLAGKHFVGMDKVAWNLLRDIYGGDVAVVRKTFDLYGESP